MPVKGLLSLTGVNAAHYIKLAVQKCKMEAVRYLYTLTLHNLSLKSQHRIKKKLGAGVPKHTSSRDIRLHINSLSSNNNSDLKDRFIMCMYIEHTMQGTGTHVYKGATACAEIVTKP